MRALNRDKMSAVAISGKNKSASFSFANAAIKLLSPVLTTYVIHGGLRPTRTNQRPRNAASIFFLRGSQRLPSIDKGGARTTNVTAVNRITHYLSVLR
jgi:hypothetical protein